MCAQICEIEPHGSSVSLWAWLTDMKWLISSVTWVTVAVVFAGKALLGDSLHVVLFC